MFFYKSMTINIIYYISNISASCGVRSHKWPQITVNCWFWSIVGAVKAHETECLHRLVSSASTFYSEIELVFIWEARKLRTASKLWNTSAKLQELRFVLLQHLSCSSDLLPGAPFLFSDFKRMLGQKKSLYKPKKNKNRTKMVAKTLKIAIIGVSPSMAIMLNKEIEFCYRILKAIPKTNASLLILINKLTTI